MTQSEFHLFVLWSKGTPYYDSVLKRIGQAFAILRVIRLHWQRHLFAANLTRFYGQHLPPGSDKERSCGMGPLTLIVVRDDSPSYAMRQTTSGSSLVNTRVFDLKAHFRSASGGRLPIHATNTPTETAHDLALLLGIDVAAFEQAYPGTWSGEIIDIKRDISGTAGWRSLRELFSILNATVGYVVLRNFDELPDAHRCDLHGDIDLLVDSLVDAVLVANARPVFDDPFRVHYTVAVNGITIPFDFRYCGDDYYDPCWQKDLLASRRLAPGGFYVPHPEQHFYSLLYHAAVHKTAVSLEYQEKLAALAVGLGIALPQGKFFDEPRRLRSFLQRFMSPRGYRFTRPHDPSVIFCDAVATGWGEHLVQRIFPARKAAPHPPPAPLPLPPLPPYAGTYDVIRRSLGFGSHSAIVEFTSDRPSPFDQVIQSRDDTVLVVAPNVLGVRRFNGLSDDTALPSYAGLYGIDPTAVGRRQLARTLATAGLDAQHPFFLFPDHEHPKVVIADSALQADSFDVGNLLALTASRDCSGRCHPCFHENLAWRSIIENGLLPDLANSFLVVAGRSESVLVDLDVDLLALVYSSERLSRYATETIFRKSPGGKVTVEKRSMYPDAASNVQPPPFAGGLLLHRTGTVADYVPGELYIVELQRRMARGEGLEAVIDWARDWLELVKAARIDDSTLLPGHWLDAIPQNFIRTADGKLANIDAEWSVSQPVPAAWVIFRGLMNALAVCPTSPALGSLSLLEAIRHISVPVGIKLDDAAIQQACALEADLRASIYGETREEVKQDLQWHLVTSPQASVSGPTYREMWINKCAALENEILRVKSTVSWKVTMPLRFLAFLWRKLTHTDRRL
jgi:predicted RNase H-like HicB family nuclease